MWGLVRILHFPAEDRLKAGLRTRLRRTERAGAVVAERMRMRPCLAGASVSASVRAPSVRSMGVIGRTPRRECSHGGHGSQQEQGRSAIRFRECQVSSVECQVKARQAEARSQRSAVSGQRPASRLPLHPCHLCNPWSILSSGLCSSVVPSSPLPSLLLRALRVSVVDPLLSSAASPSRGRTNQRRAGTGALQRPLPWGPDGHRREGAGARGANRDPASVARQRSRRGAARRRQPHWAGGGCGVPCGGASDGGGQREIRGWTGGLG